MTAVAKDLASRDPSPPLPLQSSYFPADTSVGLVDCSVGDTLRRVAAQCPDRVAVVHVSPTGERYRVTYGRLLEEAEGVARALLAKCSPGDRIAVWAQNLPKTAALTYGVALAGMTLVPLDPAYTAQELKFALDRARARMLFYTPVSRGHDLQTPLASVRDSLTWLHTAVSFDGWDSFLSGPRSGTALPVVASTEPFALVYTSGTTGHSKGALRDHRSMLSNGLFVAMRRSFGGQPVNVSCTQFFHVGGMALSAFGALMTSSTLVMIQQFEPGLVLDVLETEGATSFIGVPTMYVRMMEHPDFRKRDLSRLRCATAGSSNMPGYMIRRLSEAWGVPVTNAYGQTEALVTATTAIDDTPLDLEETVGKPVPHTELKIVDVADRSTVVPLGEIGEILVRGHSTMIEYDGLPEETAQTKDADGWLRTGDVGSMDSRGYVTVKGRLREVIIRGGQNVYPKEVELAVVSHKKVQEAAVIGVPDEHWGERVAVFVVAAEPDLDLEAVRSAVAKRLAHYKVPELWTVVDSLPRTTLGKVQKGRLVWPPALADGATLLPPPAPHPESRQRR